MRQKIKPFLFILIAVFALVFLAGCKKGKYVKLELPEQVEANVKKLNKIRKGTEVTLTITVPDGKEIDQLLVNEVAVLVDNNTYTFIIEEDTVVEVSFVSIGEKVFYSLFLPPKGVKADVDNLSRIPKDTLVTLTVTVEGEVTLLVNGQAVLLTNGKYSFKITKDTNVELKAFTEVEKGSVANLLTIVDTKVLRKGKIAFDLEMDDLEGLQQFDGQIELDDELNMTEMLFNASYYSKHMSTEWFSNQTTYNDGLYQYRISEGSETSYNYELLEMMPLSNYGIDILERYSSVPFSPAQLGDTLSGLMAYIYKNAQSFAVYEHVKVYELDPYHKVVLKLSGEQFRQVLRPIVGHELFKDAANLDVVEIEVLYKNLKVQSIAFEGNQKGAFGGSAKGSISYTDELIVPPARFDELDKSSFNIVTVNLHDNGKVDVVKFDKALLHKIIYYLPYPFAKNIMLYKDGYESDLYIDELKTTAFSDSYMLLDNDEIDLYIDWVKIDLFDEFYTRFSVDDDGTFALKADWENIYYLENDDYIYLKKDGYSSKYEVIHSKADNKYYYLTIDSSDNYVAYDVEGHQFNLFSLRDKYLSVNKENVILLGERFTDLEQLVTFDDYYIIFDGFNNYEDSDFSLVSTEFDNWFTYKMDIPDLNSYIEGRINTTIEDEIAYVKFTNIMDIPIINSLEIEDAKFIIDFVSGSYKIYSLKELQQYFGVTYRIESDDTLTIIDDSDNYMGLSLVFDGSRGPVIFYFHDYSFEYLDEISEFKALEKVEILEFLGYGFSPDDIYTSPADAKEKLKGESWIPAAPQFVLDEGSAHNFGAGKEVKVVSDFNNLDLYYIHDENKLILKDVFGVDVYELIIHENEIIFNSHGSTLTFNNNANELEYYARFIKMLSGRTDVGEVFVDFYEIKQVMNNKYQIVESGDDYIRYENGMVIYRDDVSYVEYGINSREYIFTSEVSAPVLEPAERKFTYHITTQLVSKFRLDLAFNNALSSFVPLYYKNSVLDEIYYEVDGEPGAPFEMLTDPEFEVSIYLDYHFKTPTDLLDKYITTPKYILQDFNNPGNKMHVVLGEQIDIFVSGELKYVIDLTTGEYYEYDALISRFLELGPEFPILNIVKLASAGDNIFELDDTNGRYTFAYLGTPGDNISIFFDSDILYVNSFHLGYGMYYLMDVDTNFELVELDNILDEEGGIMGNPYMYSETVPQYMTLDEFIETAVIRVAYFDHATYGMSVESFIYLVNGTLEYVNNRYVINYTYKGVDKTFDPSAYNYFIYEEGRGIPMLYFTLTNDFIGIQYSWEIYQLLPSNYGWRVQDIRWSYKDYRATLYDIVDEYQIDHPIILERLDSYPI